MNNAAISVRGDRPPVGHLLLVLLAALALYWPRLGSDGLYSSEGHRAIPGWEALESGQWIPTTLHGTVYVRKPPGMPWAVAGSSILLGETEFAARAVSALACTLMSLVACWFAARWFGSGWGLAAGLAQVLFPRFWTSGRSAEIEALLCLGTQLAAFALLEAIRRQAASSARERITLTLIAALGLIVALLAKGHAGLPVILGVILGASIALRSWSPLRCAPVWSAAAIAAIVTAPVAILTLRAMRGPEAVTEDLTSFLWSGRRFVEWLALPFSTFVAALPASLAWLFPWGPDARREQEQQDADPRTWFVARTLAIGMALAVGVYWIFGVHNSRYLMPAMTLLPPLVAYVARGSAAFFTPTRRAIARAMFLGSPHVMLGALAIGAAVYLSIFEPRRNDRSGRGPGEAISRRLLDGDTIWGGSLIDAKPEVLWYAVRRARIEGRAVTSRWMPIAVGNAELPPAGILVLLRDFEYEAYQTSGSADRLNELERSSVDEIPFILLRSAGPTSDQPEPAR